MATTKKTSTKAKTKTTKSKATPKSSRITTKSKKTSASKTVSKAMSTKSVNASSVSVRSGLTSVRKLRGLHMISVGLFLLLGLAAAFLMKGDSYQLTLGHVAKNELTGALVPAVQAIYDVELRWLVVALMAISAIAPVLYMTKLQDRYSEFLYDTRMLPMRWVDVAVTGALTVEIVALVSGVSDIATLKLLGGVVVIAAALGLIAERQNNDVKKPVRSAYYVSLFAWLIVGLFVLSYAASTIVYAQYAPWYIYALYAVVFAGMVVFARNMRMYLRGANYLIVERNYIVISTVVKVAIAAVLTVGLLREL